MHNVLTWKCAHKLIKIVLPCKMFENNVDPDQLASVLKPADKDPQVF